LIGVGASVGRVAMALELVPVKVDDNLTSIVVGLTAWGIAWAAGVPLT
jgi:hypothetical protein